MNKSRYSIRFHLSKGDFEASRERTGCLRENYLNKGGMKSAVRQLMFHPLLQNAYLWLIARSNPMSKSLATQQLLHRNRYSRLYKR